MAESIRTDVEQLRLPFLPKLKVTMAMPAIKDHRYAKPVSNTDGCAPDSRTISTAAQPSKPDSTLSQDANGNTTIGPLVNGQPTGSITGFVGTFKGNGGGVIGWDTDIVPNGFTIGVLGFVDNTDGSALFGRANATTGSARGVTGRSLSSDGFGVVGRAGPEPTSDDPNPVGSATGVLGASTTTTGIGVIGRSISNIGVLGEVTEQAPIGVGSIVGVLGQTATTSGLTEGVSGLVYSPNGTAGVFRNRGGGDILARDQLRVPTCFASTAKAIYFS